MWQVRQISTTKIGRLKIMKGIIKKNSVRDGGGGGWGWGWGGGSERVKEAGEV